MNVEWLIIGGGIHGGHIAARLIGDADLDPDRIRIIDPNSRLLERWRTFTSRTGMTHLRSPAVHHLDRSVWSLQQFAGKRGRRKLSVFAAPYDRPSLSLFNAHCDKVIETYGIDSIHVKDRAETVTVNCVGARVQLSSGSQVQAKNVVLAMGMSEQPAWPDWAPRRHGRVHHIFEPMLPGEASARETVAIVGAGISACQLALRLIKERHQVHLVSRHDLKEHQFDSDPGWLGPRYMTAFNLESDPDRRRGLIAKARHRGSVPPDVLRAVRRAIRRKQLVWHDGNVEACKSVDESGLEIALTTRKTIMLDRLYLATGYANHRPGGEMIRALIASASLPCAKCGYPIVDSALRWHPHIFVSGPLAELELGPVARNISGARRAADRLVNWVHRQTVDLKRAS